MNYSDNGELAGEVLRTKSYRVEIKKLPMHIQYRAAKAAGVEKSYDAAVIVVQRYEFNGNTEFKPDQYNYQIAPEGWESQ